MDLARFRELPLLGILRGIEARDVESLIDAFVAAGLRAVEITMNTRSACELIQAAVLAANGRLMVGAGTVLDTDTLASARLAGATFIVSPTLVADVVRECVSEKIPVFPGALTPTEIHAAWNAGATMVKVFPASAFGPGYLKEVRGPFAGVELMAVGGVNVENMRDYFAAGASAVAFGASVVRREWLERRDYARIHDEVRTLVTACATARGAS